MGMLPWDLSCTDWEERIIAGKSWCQAFPLFSDEAEMAVAIFDELRLPDVPACRNSGMPAATGFATSCVPCSALANPATNRRMIREVLALVPNGAVEDDVLGGMIITAMIMNARPRAEMLFVGPTQAISDRAFAQAQGMIEADPDLKNRSTSKEHLKEIHDRQNKS